MRKTENNEKCTILCVIRHPVGGIRTYLKYTYRYFNEEKYKFIFIAAKEKEGILIKSDLHGFYVDYREVSEKNVNFGLFYTVFKALKNEKIDLIHSHGFTAGVLSILSNIMYRLPHVITSHDVFRENHFEGVRGNFKKKILSVLLNLASVVQMVGQDALINFQKYMPEFEKKMHKLRVIQNGINVNAFESVNTAGIRKKLNIEEGTKIFGFLGRFMPQKGFDLIIETVVKLSKYKYKYKIVAVNDGAFIKEYKEEINRRGYIQYFEFLPFTPNVIELLNEFDALLMPSRWEALSLVAMEALVAGCPLIASDCIGLKEIVEGTPAQIVGKENINDIAIAMKNIILDKKNEFKKESKKYKKIAKDRFTSERTAKELEDLFKNIIDTGTTFRK